MAKASEIKRLAESLKIPYNSSWSDDDILASIADRIGVGYDYSESSKNNLLSALKEMNGENVTDQEYETLDDYDDVLDDVDEYPDEYQDEYEEYPDDDSGEQRRSSSQKKEDKSSNDEKSSDSKLKDGKKSNTDNDVKPKDKPSQNNDSSKRANNSSNVDNARKNLEHNNRMKKGPAEDAAKKGADTAKKGADTAKKGADAAKKGTDVAAKQAKKAADTSKAAAKKVKDGAKKGAKSAARAIGRGIRAIGNFITTKLIPFIMAHPWILLVVLFVLFFIILLVMVVIFVGEGENNGSNTQYGTGSCKYELNGILSSGPVELNGIKVEIINCDGVESSYDVLETVDFEKYVLGASLALVGENASDEALKAQIIATRNYILTRNSAVCPGNQDNCFYGYNPSNNIIRLRACDTDLVYWNYSSDMYYSSSSGKTLYSPEINEGTVYKYALSDERKKEVESIAQQVSGKVLLDSSGNVYKTSKESTSQFVTEAQNEKKYEEILDSVYGTTSYSSATCSSYGNIDYGDYVIESSNDEIILQEPLSDFLASKGTSLDEFNALIENNVNSAGYGTRAGVVASAVTLIAELGNKYGVRVPYFWGGGHVSNFIQPYADGRWGSGSCSAYDKAGFHYDRCGLDCSGFVPWAIYNGGFDMKEARLAHTFVNMEGAQKVELNANEAVLQPGDLLESSMHIVLVIGVDEANKQYICAEASGYQYGVWFTRRKFNEKDYYGLKMDDYYNNPSNIRSK